MKGTNLGELEEIVLLIVLNLGADSYSLRIREELVRQCDRSVSLGTIHATLHRLERKGYLNSEYDKSSDEKRRGRPKLVFTATANGNKALKIAKEIRNKLWKNISEEKLKTI